MHNDLYQMDVLTMHELFIKKSQYFIEASKLGKSSHVLAEMHKDLSNLFSVLREKLWEAPQEENLIY